MSSKQNLCFLQSKVSKDLAIFRVVSGGELIAMGVGLKIALSLTRLARA